MIQCGDGSRLTLEALACVGVVSEVRGQDLDRHSAIESRVARCVDLAHPARADLRRQLIRADASTLEILHHCRVVDSNQHWCVRKALRTRVPRQERFHLLAQGLVAAAPLGEVRGAPIRRQRQRALERISHARPVFREKGHALWILLLTVKRARVDT
jgi:hypothetical protein